MKQQRPGAIATADPAGRLAGLLERAERLLPEAQRRIDALDAMVRTAGGATGDLRTAYRDGADVLGKIQGLVTDLDALIMDKVERIIQAKVDQRVTDMDARIGVMMEEIHHELLERVNELFVGIFGALEDAMGLSRDVPTKIDFTITPQDDGGPAVTVSGMLHPELENPT